MTGITLAQPGPCDHAPIRRISCDDKRREAVELFRAWVDSGQVTRSQLAYWIGKDVSRVSRYLNPRVNELPDVQTLIEIKELGRMPQRFHSQLPTFDTAEPSRVPVTEAQADLDNDGDVDVVDLSIGLARKGEADAAHDGRFVAFAVNGIDAAERAALAPFRQAKERAAGVVEFQMEYLGGI